MLFSRLLVPLILVVSNGEAALALEPGEVYCQYQYSNDKEVEETTWNRLVFTTYTSPISDAQTWSAKPTALENSPFNALTFFMTSRTANPDLLEISIQTKSLTVEVIENNFFSGMRDTQGITLFANLAKNSETIPEIKLAENAEGFPNGYVVLGVKCEQKLTGVRSIWPKIRRKL